MRTYKIGIFSTWALAFLVSSILTLLVWFRAVKTSIYVWMAYAVAILLIACGCNIGIWRRSHRKARIVSSRNTLNIERLTYTLLFVSFLALVCWIPLVIANFLSHVCEISAPWLSFARITAEVLNYCNAFVNPFVYAFRVREFRQALRLCCLDEKVEVERNGKNTTPAFQAQNNQAIETEL